MTDDGRLAISAADGVASDGDFVSVQRVRFGDLDAMQHMNNVQFLRFFETARVDYIRTLAADHRRTPPGEFGFIIAECHIAYRSPAFFDDEIHTTIRPTEVRRSSVRLDFEMRVGTRLVSEGYGVLVSYDYAQSRVQRLPRVLRERLERAAARRPQHE